MASSIIVFFFIFFLTCVSTVFADSGNLQDACPRAPGKQTVFINGFPCKNPAEISASDFRSSKLNHAGDTDNFQGSSVTIATAVDFAGLNTLGLSIARSDLEAFGMVAPHTHPRSSEMLFIDTGIVTAGFVDTKNQIFKQVLKEGDVFIFPRGLLHFCFNSGFESATAYSVFNSQNPGTVSISGAMFALDREGLEKRIRGLMFNRGGNESLT